MFKAVYEVTVSKLSSSQYNYETVNISRLFRLKTRMPFTAWAVKEIRKEETTALDVERSLTAPCALYKDATGRGCLHL